MNFIKKILYIFVLITVILVGWWWFKRMPSNETARTVENRETDDSISSINRDLNSISLEEPAYGISDIDRDIESL